MSEIPLRPWTEEDLPSVRHITWTTWVAAYSSFVPVEDLRDYFEKHYDLEALRTFFRTQSNGGFVAFAGDRCAGYVRTGYSTAEKRFYVMSLYVLPEYQGRGLGHRLMEASERAAAGCGVDRVWLGVMEQNTKTVEWYRKMGFRFVEQAPFTMGKTSVNHYIGYRLLPPRSDH